jgi:lysophospholipase L1-like esterase
MTGGGRFDAEVAALATRLAAAARVDRPIVVYGSSTVRLWTGISAALDRADVIAVGFGGARLTDLARHCERLVAPLDPRRLVVAAGANDLEEPGTTPADIVARMHALIDTARRDDATLPIDVLTLKPAPVHAPRMPAILAANRALAASLAAVSGVTLVDTCSAFLGAGGQADPRWYADDRRHMNAAGYALWARLLAAALEHDPDEQSAQRHRRHA